MTVSESQKKATSKFNKKKYDSFLIRVPSGGKDILKELADMYGVSVNALMMMGIRQLIQNNPPEGIVEPFRGKLATFLIEIAGQAIRGETMRGSWQVKGSRQSK